MGLFSKIKDIVSKVQQENRENAGEKTAPTAIFDRLRNKLENMQSQQQKKRGRTRSKSTSSDSIFSEITKQFEQAKQENTESPTEETADISILERIQKEMEAARQERELEVEEKSSSSPDWGSPSSAPSVDDILGRVLAGAHKEQQSKKTAPKKEEDFGAIFDSIMKNEPVSSATERKPEFSEVLDQVTRAESQVEPTTRNAGLYVGGTALVDGRGGSLAVRIEPNMGSATLAQRLPDNVNVRLLEHDPQNTINIDGQNASWYKVDYQGLRGWVLDVYLE